MNLSLSKYSSLSLNYWMPIILFSVILTVSFLYAQEPISSEFSTQTYSAPTEEQAHPNIGQQRKEAEEHAQENLIQEAVSAIQDIKKAIVALDKGQEQEALEAIKKATGTIDILVGRHPQDALLPVDFEVRLFDKAPDKLDAIKSISKSAEQAIKNKDYPSARLTLDNLRSEINIRTYHLPLAAYPEILKNAARLLDEKKLKESASGLKEALHILVIVDRYIPLPIIKAKSMLAQVQEAQRKQEGEKDNLLKLLAQIRHELEKGQALGYAGLDEEYPNLAKSLLNLEKQIKANESSSSGLAKLKEKLTSFLNRHSETKKATNQVSLDKTKEEA
jgi:hypothetical protein